MNNNDILIRIRYALDIKNIDMVEIFKLGGIEVTEQEVLKMLKKIEDNNDNKDSNKKESNKKESNNIDSNSKDNNSKDNNSKDRYINENSIELEENEVTTICDNYTLESFLNGLIIFKRGKQESNSGQPERPPLSIKNNKSVNNVMLKKMKIALALSSEDMLDIFREAGVNITKGELSAVFRKEGQRNYKECGDRYARNFLKGLAIKYRND